MTKEFKLSLHEFPEGYFPKDKVKECFRLIKEEINTKSDDKGMIHYAFVWQEIIDKFTGDL